MSPTIVLVLLVLSNVNFALSSSFNAKLNSGSVDASNPFGLLENFAGVWRGNGFNVISLPDFDHTSPSTGPQNYRVLASNTTETLTFTSIGAVANRGSLFRLNGDKGQNDITMYGLTYLQQISDAISGAALHVEPGIWLHVPSTKSPNQNETYVRMATVPHGDSLLAQSVFAFSTTGPLITNVSSLPTGQHVNAKFLETIYNCALPEGITQNELLNPNLLLSKAIMNQRITETVVISISTAPFGGIVNIPFVAANADATEMTALFWVETMERADGSTFLQMQYTQTVLLNFVGVTFPHITVSTLVKDV